MNCRDVQERLDDYVDGTVRDAEAATLALHLEDCPACRQDERELRTLLSRAAAFPREETPRGDLWPGILARIRSGKVVQGAFASGGSRAWLPAAAAAAGLLIVLSTALVGYFLGQRSMQVEVREGPPITGTFRSIPAAHRPILVVESEFEEARNDLLALLEQRKDSLKPETLVEIQANLRLMDRSLSEIWAALEEDPTNPELTRFLVATYRREVDLLQRVNSWFTQM